MKLKNKKTISVLLAAFIVVSTTIWLVNIHKKENPTLSNDCSAVFAMQDKAARFSARLSIYLNMRDDNTGYLDITGKVNRDDVDYTAARAWRFNYRLQSGNTLHLTQIAMDKRAADNAPDDLVDKLIFSTDPGTGRYVKIAVLNNAWVISNLYSPQFLCVINAS